MDDVVYYATPGNLTNLSVDEIIIDCEVTGRAAFDKYISSSHMGFINATAPIKINGVEIGRLFMLMVFPKLTSPIPYH